eukprot:scaffold43716_cov69-Phaeocystis_antarctica.AAC.2
MKIIFHDMDMDMERGCWKFNACACACHLVVQQSQVLSPWCAHLVPPRLRNQVRPRSPRE